MTDILEEASLDHSDEKKLFYFKRLLPIVAIFTLLVAVLMLLSNSYDDRRTRANQLEAETLLSAISTMSYDKDLAMESLAKIIVNAKSKVGEIASLEQVSIKIAQEDYAGAKISLQKIIDSQYTELTKNYAKLLWLSLVIDQTVISDSEKQQADIYFKYFNNDNQPFYGTVSIIKSIWYVRYGLVDLAVSLLKKIISLNDMNQLIKDQAKAMLSNLERK